MCAVRLFFSYFQEGSISSNACPLSLRNVGVHQALRASARVCTNYATQSTFEVYEFVAGNTFRWDAPSVTVKVLYIPLN